MMQGRTSGRGITKPHYSSALINNAATLESQMRLDSMEASRLERIFAVNVLGSMICAREATEGNALGKTRWGLTSERDPAHPCSLRTSNYSRDIIGQTKIITILFLRIIAYT